MGKAGVTGLAPDEDARLPLDGAAGPATRPVISKAAFGLWCATADRYRRSDAIPPAAFLAASRLASARLTSGDAALPCLDRGTAFLCRASSSRLLSRRSLSRRSAASSLALVLSSYPLENKYPNTSVPWRRRSTAFCISSRCFSSGDDSILGRNVFSRSLCFFTAIVKISRSASRSATRRSILATTLSLGLRDLKLRLIYGLKVSSFYRSFSILSASSRFDLPEPCTNRTPDPDGPEYTGLVRPVHRTEEPSASEG